MLQESNILNEVISSYSRAQALEDGYLINITDDAMKAGFKVPVAVTKAVWYKYIEWSNKDTHQQTYQDQSGRLADILWMLSLACNRSNKSSILFSLYCIPRNGRTTAPRLIKLRAIIDGGDNGEPVITVMLPDED